MPKTQIETILNHYGKNSQENKAIEELCELVRAICKKDLENIIEEIADVEIMLEQLKLIYGIDDEALFHIKAFKLTRCIEKFNKGGTNHE